MPSKCESCSKEDARFRCSACKSVWYCNTDCQKAGWKNHKTTCSKTPAAAPAPAPTPAPPPVATPAVKVEATPIAPEIPKEKDANRRLNIVMVDGDRATIATIRANEIDHSWGNCLVPSMLGYPLKYKRMRSHKVKPSREVAIFMFVDPVSGLAAHEWQVSCGVVAFALKDEDFSVQLFWDLYSYIFHLMDFYGEEDFNYVRYSRVHLQRQAFLRYQAEEHQIQANYRNNSSIYGH